MLGQARRAVLVAALAVALSIAPSAGAVDWRKEEARYKRAYPAFMRVALPRVPYRKPLLRMMYFAGGVGLYYGSRADRRLLCALAADDPTGFKRAARRQLFGSPSSYRDAREAGVSQAQVLTAYHRGALLGCSSRRG